ncbi:hypothetical protein HU200_018560 [Digitaria exilis]|uniref:chitinase n=1 Tax=Digitaria exilis TaxID=1010633 RepID=A0A835F4J5_9POAL|nr:hypothetical protein HU200_018560 [Digitaria exilis]
MATRLAVAAMAAALLLAVAAADVGSIITQDVYNSMLPNRDNSICPANGFYTYDAFIQAANASSRASAPAATATRTTGASSPPSSARPPTRQTANYQQAGDAIGEDLVSNPDLVSTDPVISFKTAIWFWMTAQSPKPSCHDVILGNWTPSSADAAAGRVPGYGAITNIINGGIECGVGPNDANVNRIGYYEHYCDMLGVGYGDNLDCYSQQHF